jgi:GDP-mannose 6-dehydrogenase
MRVAVFGLGYVGCVSAACLARDGHRVTGVDVNPLKVAQVNAGRSPVTEHGLDELIGEVRRAGTLQATGDGRAAIVASELSLVCVGTPSNHNGSLDHRHVERVCGEIGAALADVGRPHVVVVRSTVLPGISESRLLPILEKHSGRPAGSGFGYCVNPEFLREGSALADYRAPSQIVIGELDQAAGDAAGELYQEVSAPVLRMSVREGEMLKYVSNAFHALKVGFANEIGTLCKMHGIDGQALMEVFCSDRALNVSPAYLRPGFAFGGSCLPKDLRALLYRAKEQDVDSPILAAVLESNRHHFLRAVDLVEQTGLRRAGILGLSFKAGTDDVRESPTVALVETLLGRGYEVAIYDENVDPARLVGENRASLERDLPHIAAHMASSVAEVLRRSDVIVVANATPTFRCVASLLREGQRLVDLVGIPRSDRPRGDRYEGICW